MKVCQSGIGDGNRAVATDWMRQPSQGIRNLSMPPVSNQHGLRRPRSKKARDARGLQGVRELYLIENNDMAMLRTAIFITGL